MKKIYQLPEILVAKIAAGEVIERPAYVVKELIENAIDANATDIKIVIEQAGLKRIQVTDNGEGMSREDVLQSFRPHTTSKISTEHDLQSIKTLGFRGEALSSIAAAANVTMQSKTKKDVAGTEITITNGEISAEKPIGMPTGTTIIITDLFSTVPARKKFLKNPKTEYRRSIEVITNFALAYPQIRFTVINNGRLIMDLPKTSEQSDRITQLLGKSVIQNSIPIGHTDTYISVTGLIVKPHLTTKSVSKQLLFVNKRRVFDTLITNAIKDAYGPLLERNKQPIFVLFLTIPYEHVDVNVHPQKTHVRFTDQTMLYDIINQTVKKSLEQFTSFVSYIDLLGDEKFMPGKTDTFAASQLREIVDPWSVKIELDNQSAVQQLHKTYLATQTKNGLLLVDQHAAHERILFEQFKNEFIKLRKHITTLKKPQTIELSLLEQELLKENRNELEKLGFTFQLDKKEMEITHVPKILQDRNAAKIIKEILEDIENKVGTNIIDQQSNKMLAYLACRSAIMAGDKLTSEEGKKLIEQLEKIKHNQTCPHGRPTKIEVTLNRIDKVFKRR